MKTPLIFLICIVATFAIIEAVPWFRHNPTKIYGKTESENNGAADFGVDEIGVNGDDTEIKSGEGLTRGDQNADENQDEGEGLDDEGGNGYQSRRGFQAGRGIQGGRRPQGGHGNKSFESIGGRRNLGGRGYPGTRRNEGRRNQDSGDDSEYHKTSDEDDSFEDAALRWQEVRRRFFGYYGRQNQVGKSYEYPRGSRFQGQGYPSYRDEGRNGNENNNEEEDQDHNGYKELDRNPDSSDDENRWQQSYPGSQGDCGNTVRNFGNGTFQVASGGLDTNGCQYGNQNENNDNRNMEYDGDQDYADGNQNEKLAGKGNRGGYNYGSHNEGQAGSRGQAGFRGQAGNTGEAGFRGQVGNRSETGFRGQAGNRGEAGFRGQVGNRSETGFRGQAGNRDEAGFRGQVGNRGETGFRSQADHRGRASNNEENGDENQGHNRSINRDSRRIPNIMNIGNGEGNRNTVYLH
ncbi:collagen alpha-2(I) chain-like isoform X2 [Maniola jurtina]|uniref:collagen alpha-2(I) chain-like isoform X2 n=1 Tax=Maniola jurtina TaxID=191418 RepID=UPI001E68DC96|nr:collagen alpha-2(I) chain-like isoform X2 [Maniola jurtina]